MTTHKVDAFPWPSELGREVAKKTMPHILSADIWVQFDNCTGALNNLEHCDGSSADSAYADASAFLAQADLQQC